jgi:hypothetical protein
MQRLVLVGALLAGACGATDDRPRTLAYITETILAPSCASAECHSAFRRQVGDQFDTVDATRVSIVANGLVTLPDDVANPSGSILIQTLTVGSTSVLDPKSGKVRMPYDAPMPDADVELIRDWIAQGAHGAQCLANEQGRGCATDRVPDPANPGRNKTVFRVVQCSPDGDVGATVMVCPGAQFCSISSGNGQCIGQP